MPTERRKKVVQTEIESDDYEIFLELTKSKNMTIKQAASEALRLWTASSSDLGKDAFFKLRPVKFKIKVRHDEIDAFLYKRK